jgi:nucleoside-diphosphate-sugar epimerase
VRFFVTGATGFIGSRVAELLLSQGHRVAALVRDPARAEGLRKWGADLVPGNLADRAALHSGMQRADGLFHIAGWYETGVNDTRPAWPINVEGTRNVLEVMREVGVPRGVYTSTLAVNSNTRGRIVDEFYRFSGRHLSEYDRTKAVAHRQVAEPMIRDGLPLTIVMPGAVYGPGDHSGVRATFEQYLRGRLMLLPKQTALCWGHVEDTAEAHLLAMEQGRSGETYMICGAPATLEEAFSLAEEITGVPVPKLRVGPGGMRLLSRVMGLANRLVSLPPIYHPETLRITAGVTYLGSNRKAREELGFAPRPLREGLAEVLPELARELGVELPKRP